MPGWFKGLKLQCRKLCYKSLKQTNFYIEWWSRHRRWKEKCNYIFVCFQTHSLLGKKKQTRKNISSSSVRLMRKSVSRSNVLSNMKGYHNNGNFLRHTF